MKEHKNLVSQVVTMTEDLNKLTVDEVAKTPVTEPEPQTQLTHRQIADSMNLKYIEPKRKLAGFGKLPEKLKAEHARDWEYVKGVYENIESVGETLEFWLCLYAGDPDCLWSIPCNTPLYVPRMVAKHLEECQKYHKFDYIDRSTAHLNHGDFTSTFAASETIYRGKFRPMEAFR